MSNAKVVMGQAANTLTAPLNVEDVFSTYLYTGTGAAQTITNDIDLDGEGGLVWIKARNVAASHRIYDTERGATYQLEPNSTDVSNLDPDELTAFNSNGFTVGADAQTGGSGTDYASWTFRKAPKFFDVVTWTGDGVAGREIAHNLGSVPGCMIVKCLNNVTNWAVYHRGVDSTAPEDYVLRLNDTTARANSSVNWNDTAPTSTDFTLGTNSWVNRSGDTYVAYLFAHNDGDGEFGPDGDADIIKCGSFTDNSSGWSVDLGFEPQFLLAKRADSTGNWEIVDTMRGFTADRSYTRLYPNLTNTEQTVTKVGVNSTGFFSTTAMETNGATIIYIAIRRGTKVPESGTEVFGIDRGGQSNPSYVSGFPVDMGYALQTPGGTTYTTDRLRGTKLLATSNTNAEANNNSYVFDYMDGMYSYSSVSTQVAHMWKRAPGFFDVVAYTGNGVAGRTVSHNLGVAPEMMWVRKRNAAGLWRVYHKGLNGGTNPEQYGINLNETSAEYDLNTLWNDTAPTASVFSLGTQGNVNGSSSTYIAYLFASLPGISKVGSYTGNGTSQTIDCGFTSGARFILVKRTDSTGDWYVWDTERGIVAGNDPYLELNTTDAEVTSTDWVDPDNSGFIVNGTTINASSASYIFYAIA